MSNHELVRATLEMLVIKTLALESMHRYGIAHRIEQMSGLGKFAGSGARRKTTAGRHALEQECRQWGRQIAAIVRILET